jgi:hypothetical protein
MTTSPLTSIAHIREFMTAGNATLTIRSKLTSTRFTFKLVKSPDDGRSTQVIFVKLLNGSDNEESFRFMGTLFPNQASFYVYRHSVKSSISPTAASVRALSYFMRAITLAKELPKDLEVWHEGRCGRCGRKLTVPESIKTGLGPECEGRVRQRPLQLEARV